MAPPLLVGWSMSARFDAQLLEALRLLVQQFDGNTALLDPGIKQLGAALTIRSDLERSDSGVARDVPAVSGDAALDVALPRLLTTNELAERLHVSGVTARRLLASGDIPSMLLGKSRRVRVQDVIDFQQRKVVETRAKGRSA